MLVGFEYNKENFFYSRDLTGVINNIVDKNGNVVVKCEYDAWGNLLNKDQAAKLPIGETLLELNPFIYKGYIYDFETNLYYLKSRYYSPKIRMFISPDSLIGDVGNIDNYNLFAYCNNNPIMSVDNNGNFAITSLIGSVLLGAFVGAAIDLGTQLVGNGFDFKSLDWGSAVNSAVVGGALGVTTLLGSATLVPLIAGTAGATGTSALAALATSTAISFGAGALGYAAEEWINSRTPSFSKSMINGGLVAFQGMFSFALGGVMGSFGKPFSQTGKTSDMLNGTTKKVFELMFGEPIGLLIDLIRKNI